MCKKSQKDDKMCEVLVCIGCGRIGVRGSQMHGSHTLCVGLGKYGVNQSTFFRLYIARTPGLQHLSTSPQLVVLASPYACQHSLHMSVAHSLCMLL